MALGIDVGGTKTRCIGLADNSELVFDEITPTLVGADGVVETVLRLIEHCLKDNGRTISEVTSVGLGIPGAVDYELGIVRNAVNLRISELPLRQILEDALQVPVAIDNDVKAAARGASAYFGDRGLDLALINFGTGVAAAAVVKGQLIRGEGNVAGEIGHLPLDADGAVCTCGQRGCIEAMAGGGRISERLAQLDPPLSLVNLVAEAEAGNQAAIDEVNRICLGIAGAIQVLVLAYGSAVVALSGGVLDTAPALVDRVFELLRSRAKASPFIASLRLTDRIIKLPTDSPIAAMGGALLGEKAADLSLS